MDIDTLLRSSVGVFTFLFLNSFRIFFSDMTESSMNGPATSVVKNSRSMRTNFVLVDFENVQPDDLGLLKDGPFKVKLFLGPNQSKIPVALASSLQSLGENAEYVVLETAGKNALDFHIAYYLGALSTEEPTAFFHIISKDSGFDPLSKYLKARKIFLPNPEMLSQRPPQAAALRLLGASANCSRTQSNSVSPFAGAQRHRRANFVEIACPEKYSRLLPRNATAVEAGELAIAATPGWLG